MARRIRERIPAAYLTGVTWFAGHEIRVDARVLVPRSPLAELIETEFRPFIDPRRVRRILDIGTGSGCIAIACAHAFPAAEVDAADLSRGALEVAADNIRRHGLAGRLHPRLSNVYAGLGARRYDIIVSNPPYVPDADVERLPAEYRHEPALGLAAGGDGLDAVRAILEGARAHLDAGRHSGRRGRRQRGRRSSAPGRAVPFIWLDFERGGGGVFLLERDWR